MLKGATLVVSVMQFLIIFSTEGKFCATTYGLLSVESEWLYWLIGIQTGKVFTFSLWWVKIERSEAKHRDSTKSLIASSPANHSPNKTGQFTFVEKPSDVEN